MAARQKGSGARLAAIAFFTVMLIVFGWWCVPALWKHGSSAAFHVMIVVPLVLAWGLFWSIMLDAYAHANIWGIK